MLIWKENIQDRSSNGEPLSLVQLNIHTLLFYWGTTLYVTQVISHLGRHFHYTYSIYFCLLKIMHTLFSKALMYLFLYFIGNWTICFHRHNYYCPCHAEIITNNSMYFLLYKHNRNIYQQGSKLLQIQSRENTELLAVWGSLDTCRE